MKLINLPTIKIVRTSSIAAEPLIDRKYVLMQDVRILIFAKIVIVMTGGL
jgi:hypothetical protein